MNICQIAIVGYNLLTEAVECFEHIEAVRQVVIKASVGAVFLKDVAKPKGCGSVLRSKVYQQAENKDILQGGVRCIPCYR